MKKSMMRRNLYQSIKKSMGRYIAIVAIIALGAAMFVGLRTTKSDMLATGQRYMDEQNMFDLRLLSIYGWDKSDVEKIASLPGIEMAEGVISLDAIAAYEDSGVESVYKVFSIPKEINKVYLLGGRMPENKNECLADGFHANDDILGRKITITDANEDDTLSSFTARTFTIVGYVSTPLYMDMSRGNTTLGNGSVSGYMYLPEESFDVDYYSEIVVTIPGENTIYTDAYHNYVQDHADRLDPLLLNVAEDRFQTVLAQAKDAYNDGVASYESGLAEFEQGRTDAEKELTDGKQKLLDGEKEIQDNRKLLEDSIPLIESGQKTIDDNTKQLTSSKLALANAKAEAYSQLAKANTELMKNYKELSSAMSQVESGLLQINAGLTQIDSGIQQLESGLQTLETMVSVTNSMLNIAESSLDRAKRALEVAKDAGLTEDTLKELEDAVADAQAQLDKYNARLSDMKAQVEEYTKQLEELRTQREVLLKQKQELEATKAELCAAEKQIEQGIVELQSSQTQAENEFAAAEAKLQAAEIQLKAAQDDLDKSKKELEDGLAELEKAEAELEKGWDEYYKGEEQVKTELAEAETKLKDAKEELDDAELMINSMVGPEVYALGRTTNVGYLALESNSDIVEGVSAVFPAFFLLIAALVCITTMTRMIEEERTQIGTLKALGYGNWAIISKYLLYAGSAAVLGCGLGVVVGSIVFPLILWEAYQIIMLLGDYFVLQMDWMLCAFVVFIYSAVTLFVTWYCCRMSLREVPAELIRPKPPTSGKKILLEKLFFWNRISFLNKVMLRNIFRFRQRLLMMLVGIGGCTALLLTGFGIRDSINDLASNQFSEVIKYDIEVRFSENLTEDDMSGYLDELEGSITGAYFYHQSSMELEYNDQTKNVTFIAAEKGLEQFIDLHSGNEKLYMPENGQALVSVGTAKRMGISVGDKIIVRNAEMRPLELTISGLFDNNVYNYVIVSPESVENQWNVTPEIQMACVNVGDRDVHEVGAKIAEMSGVMNVTVNVDVESSVSKMLEALDLIVITVVICAALLAIIVLYNLTNINITERIREIATIKVLGFNSAESAAYVFKENLLLSAMGAVLGLGLGIVLLEFVMSKIQVDMVWMTARLAPMSYVWALIITMLSACLVDFVLFFKLEKINMAEALKSVE